MNVLLLGPYPPPAGGVQTDIVAIQDYVSRHGMRCTAMNLTRFRGRSNDKVLYPRSAVEVVWQLLRRRDDILHLHLGGDLTLRTVTLGLLCCMLPWAKAILTFHSGGYPSSPAGRACRRHGYYAFVFRRFDFVTGVNAEIVAFFRRLGVREDRLALVPPSSRLPDGEGAGGAQGVADGASAAVLAFLDRHDPALISVGLLEPEYDLERQIETMGDVLQKFPNAGLAILGSGSLDSKLRRSIASRSYADRILLCGDVAHDLTLQAMARADVLLRTTWYDGDALSVREALHLGTPIIATDNRMRPPGVHLIPARDSKRLLEAIESVLSSPSPRQPVAWNAEENVKRVLEIYRSLVEPDRFALGDTRRP